MALANGIVTLQKGQLQMRRKRLTARWDPAAAPEHSAIKEADEERHEHAGEVVRGAAPVGQPELSCQRHQLGEARGRVGACHLDLGMLLLPLSYEVVDQLLVLQVQLAGL